MRGRGHQVRRLVPVREMREYVIREHQMDRFDGATSGDLLATYASTQDRRSLPYPWWTTNIETVMPQVAARAPA
ncbi:TPA: hypothetical protein DCE37_09930 [Candidatus Latescibacteria bacterium]|nr:hypothetical protein [Candidatus Latescibacterota bacterium]